MEYAPHISDSFLHMLQVPSRDRTCSTPPTEVVETENPDLYLQNCSTYPVEDLPKQKNVLEDWGLTCVYQTSIDQLIDISVLRLLKTRHIDKLLSTYPLGILVKFESELEKWKSGLNIIDKDKITEPAETSTLGTSMNKPNLEPTLKSFKLSQELKVDEILNSSTQGSLILDYYRQNNKLNDSIRQGRIGPPGHRDFPGGPLLILTKMGR